MLKPYHIIVILSLLIAPKVYSQESYPIPENSETVKNKTQYYSSEDSDWENENVYTQDSTSLTSNDEEMEEDQKSSSKNNDKKKEDDDVLSFNFLYYIIQKFKMSDIVDQ